ncbi:NADH:flavin oxidoreductase [Planctomyces sp. SH-PL14]|uniref:NADH:flavin oxidoreductase n=1 Tax=Planctomyces sp. SH-PL14 TaxID=1632864 RepID=UPI00078D6C1B|nr:NADH:flavin oxidoreductase [Planctomyces sp. SH-PL14]AMV18353.1 NADH oxidase [Planctomyces sp. SH-PL14]
MSSSALSLPHPVENDPIFQPLTFRSGLTVKNRLFRSNVSGRFDHYNGHGTDARINWETSFARGGVGGIISSFVPVHVRGRILPNYAMIDDDDKIMFWTRLAQDVHDAGRQAWPDDTGSQREPCQYLLQLSHSGRQQDQGGVENRYKRALSSTSRNDYFHGILCQAMTRREIREVVHQFAKGAARAKAAGIDGVELHAAHGYLFTQFLSSAINDRRDEYGGSLRNRARFMLEVIDAIQQEVNGKDGPETHPWFHVQLKINAVDFDNALYPWRNRGNTLEESLELCDLAVHDGIDALHISSGSIFPHPRSPAGDFPLSEAIDWYDGMLSSGVNARFNYFVFKAPIIGPLFRWWWNYRRGVPFEAIQLGINLELAAAVKEQTPADVKVIVTGGFQHAFVIREALRSGKIDAVSIARPLIANRDLPKLFRKGMDWEHASWIPDGQWPIRNRNPCTYCNRCLLNDLENPLGCYEQSRYPDYDAMIQEVMEVFTPDPKFWSVSPPGPTPIPPSTPPNVPPGPQ